MAGKTGHRTVPGRPGVRLGPISLVWRPRQVLVTALLVAALLAVFCLNIGRGDFPIPPGDVLASLFGHGEKQYEFIVMELRLPRSLIGLLVGLGLGISGAIMQSISRNALASPDILGITQGASVAAVFLILGGGATSGALAAFGVPAAALLGGLATAILIYVLAWRRGVDGFRLILIGIGVGAALQALTAWMIVRADINDVGRAQVWLTGSLNRAAWSQVAPTAWTIGIVALVAVAGSFALAIMRLGDDVARGLGQRLQGGRALLMLASVILAAVATAAAGPIGFVAFVAPQVALRLLRSPGPPIIASALCGAILVVGGDLIARTVLPVELPVGIVTSAIGGPFLLYLLVRANRKASA
nr:iron chelate uptake ABC transporter family permease subunit [Tomitella biformata]